ncbi:reticulate body protein Rbp-7 [Candidatus Chlamydia corallus]|uniref:reticulate body protein Rbp-7 n=1 Tax=Candidatus Chlamydia corallus TaxID=2038470 RepID=UPI0012600432
MSYKITLPEADEKTTTKVEQISKASIFIFSALKEKTSLGDIHGFCQAENSLSVEANKIISVAEHTLVGSFCR